MNNPLVSAWVGLIRFGFRLLYNEFAFTYDIVSKTVSLGAWRCWQRSALKHLLPPQAGRVLEVAHGTGDLQLDLHAGGWRAIGLDLSPAMGRIAFGKLRDAGISARLVRGRAGALPFPDGAFAGIVCTFPSEFIMHPDTLREFHRVLIDNGVLAIVPGARFTSGGAARAGLEALYRVTGQNIDGAAALDQRISAHFAAFGFVAAIVEETCPRSASVVVTARKGTGQQQPSVL